MHNAILQRVKQFLNVKMVNLEKSASPAPLPPCFEEDLPPHDTSTPFFKIFKFPPPEEVIKMYFPPLKKRGVWTIVYFVCLKDSTCETWKNVFYFTSKALFVLEIIKFQLFRYSDAMTSSKYPSMKHETHFIE